MNSRVVRGEIWLMDFDPTRGREQAGRRPGLIISANLLNKSQADLVMAVPLTTTRRRVRSHVQLDPPEGGVRRTSFIMCENLRAVSKQRLLRCFGSVEPATMSEYLDVDAWGERPPASVSFA